MMTGPRAITLLLAIAVWAGQTPPQFKTRTELVQVDVVVLDAGGRPVRGLQASDFTIVDRRRPQAIQTFTEISHDRAEGAEEPRLPSDVRRDVADNATAKSQRAIVLVIHDLNLRSDLVERVRETARRIVHDLGLDASMAMLFTSGRASVELTEDRAIILDAVQSFAAVHTLGEEAFYRFLKTLENAAGYLRGDSRRKAIVAITPSVGADVTGLFEMMRPRPGPDPIYNTKADARQARIDIGFLSMMDALRRANVTLYGVDARGRLESLEERSRDARGEEVPALRMFDENARSQDGLTLTAEASGGFAILGAGDFAAGLSRIVADLDNYYVLGFYPENPDDDKWREIEVTVNRPGLTVRHRKGYRLGGKPPKPKNKDLMVVLSEGVLPKTDLRLRLFATPVVLRQKLTTVGAAIEVRDPALTATETAIDQFSITLLAVDLKRKKVVRRFDRTAAVTLGGAEAAYQFPLSLDLPPGKYQLRASARSATSGKGGSVYLMLDVPPAPAEGVAIAGVAMSEPATDGQAVLPTPVLLDRVFSSSEALRVTFWIARATGISQTSSTLEVLNAQGRVVRNATPTMNGVKAEATLTLLGLEPGAYRLRASVQAKEHHATRDVGFIVK